MGKREERKVSKRQLRLSLELLAGYRSVEDLSIEDWHILGFDRPPINSCDILEGFINRSIIDILFDVIVFGVKEEKEEVMKKEVDTTITKVFYEVTADLEFAPLEERFSDIEQAKKLKNKWQNDPQVFNVALWEITTKRKLI